jgi:hypothetical protein
MSTRTITKAQPIPTNTKGRALNVEKMNRNGLPTGNKAWNSKTRKIIHASLGYICGTCGLESDWSERADIHCRLEIGHIVARHISNDNTAPNLIAQCNTCNQDAKDAGVFILTNDVIARCRITRFMSGPLSLEQAKEFGHPRERAPLSGMASENDRREARRMRGLVW